MGEIETLKTDLIDARNKLNLSNNYITYLENKLNTVSIKSSNNIFLLSIFIILIISIFIIKIKSK